MITLSYLLKAFGGCDSKLCPSLSSRNMDEDDARGQGPEINSTRGQGSETDNARGQGSEMDNTRGQGSGIDSARGQGPGTESARGQGPVENDSNSQGSRILPCVRQDQGFQDDRRKRRRTAVSSEESDSERDYEERRRRGRSRRRYQGRRTKRRRRRSSASSGESVKAHSKSKRAKSLENDTNVILDKFLSIIKDVKSSDKPKLTYNNNVLPDFDPMTKEQTVLTWINKVEECAEIYNWDEREIIHYSLPKLVGLACTWYRGLNSLSHTWAEWKKLLIENFPCREDHAELLTEMLNKRVRYGESLEHYYYAKINLLNRCRIAGRQAVDCLLHGVDDRTVKVGAQAAQFSEPEQVLKYFRSIKVNNTKDTNDTFKKAKFDRNSSANNKPGNSRSTSNNTGIRCFNCNQIGHPSFKCDKPLVKCTNCDKIGHQSSNCYRNKVDNTTNVNNSKNRTLDKNEKQVSKLSVINRLNDIHNTQPNVLVTTNDVHSSQNNVLNKANDIHDSEPSLVDKTNDKYVMTIKINDIPFQCHVDLGSQCSLMRESEAKLLNIKLNTDVELPMLRGIGANLIRPLGLIVTSVEVQTIKETVDIYVVEDYVLNYPVLLGHSFTEKPHIVITKTPDELIFQKIRQSPKFRLISQNKTTIPVNSLRTVSVKCESLAEGRIYVDGTVRGPEGQKYYLLPGEYNVVGNNCSVLVYNVSDIDIVIEKDFLLTRATQIQMTVNVCELTISTTEIDDTINCGPNLTNEQRLQLQATLAEYGDCFSSGLKDLGYTEVTEMTIELEDSEPVVYRPYRMSHSERRLVRDMVQEMVDSGIVKESTSPYASPIVLVKKKSGEKRLCVDYRALNRKTKKEHFPMPLIEDQLDLLAGNNMFIVLDLASGYYQIAIAEDSRFKTAFVTPDGQFQFNRVPFGLVNAPSVFQRTINKILSEAKIKYALIYMDDILIPCKTFDEGLTRLKEVLGLLRKGGLTLKMNKCSFFFDKIDFLGFEVSSNGIRPGSKKCEAVSKFPKPTNQHELRQFLGLSGFFRRFIKDYALLAAPLTDLLKKDKGWVWGGPQDQAFMCIKELLSGRPVLAMYDPELETHLHTDASKNGLAGILLQRNRDGILHPVSYFSRKTTPEEQKYHSYELETLAVVASLQRFRVYLIGIPFTIQTDCNALRSTLIKRDLVPRIARWWIQLQEYDCSIEYRPGTKMAHVDALSRNPIEAGPSEPHILDILVVEPELDWITTVQSADEEIIAIKNILSDPTTEQVADIHQNFKLKNGRVYRIVGDELKWVVPRGARWQILQKNHDDVGHYGYEKTLDRIKKHFWFKRMRRFVKKYVSACLECAHHKAPGGKREGELHPIEKCSVPFHTIHADHLGPFIKSKTGNCYLLVVVDSFTKFVNITPVKNTKSLTTIKVLKNHISYFGVPTRLISDRGSSFTSKTFKDFISEYGIKHILNAVATPRANGQVERFNRTITEALATSNHGKDEKTWDERIQDIQIGINTTVHKTTQKSPSELLFGFNINHRTQGMLSTVINDTINIITGDEIESVRQEATKRIELQQQKDVERYNKHRKLGKKYKVGDLVRIERQVPHDGQSQKLVVKYQGPYRVIKILEHDRFVVEDTPLSRKGGRRYEGIVAIDKIQPWMSFDRDFDSDSTDEGTNELEDVNITSEHVVNEVDEGNNVETAN